VPPDWLGAFPYELRDGILEPTAAYQIAKIAIATAGVFAPCFFMGVTFPLLCHAYRDDARFPAALYAWNTLGACTGVLASEFLLIPWLGHDWMFALLVAASALLGAYFVAAGGAAPAAEQTPLETERGGGAASAGVALLLVCAITSGLLAGVLEADMFKRIKFLGIRTSAAMSFVSFWAVLAIFAGAAAVRAFERLRLFHVQVAFAVALTVYVAITRNLYAIHERIFGWLAAPDTQVATLPTRLFFPAGLVPLLVYVGVAVLPVFTLISLLLPYVCNRIQSERRHLGLAYGLNTVAFCAGTIAFTWVAPRVSIFYSQKLAIAVIAIGVALVATLSERRPLAAWQPLVAGAALLAACAFTPSEFDRSVMIPRTPPTVRPIRAVRSDSSFTTFVVEDRDGDLLYFDNVSLSNASPRQQTYMGLMAHFPLLAQREPKDVLLICYGVGNTAAAISTHETVRRIDVVEISRNVMLTAPEFAKWNLGVHEDPRVRFIHDDGRNFLKLTDRRYDLITSEPPPPLHEGIDRLYSREYYRAASDHLTPGGMMSQWLPVAQLPQGAVDRIIATFLDVFPHALLFSGMREELILLGSPAPIDLRNLERRFRASHRVAGHLAHLGVEDPIALLARVVEGDASLRRHFGGGPIISDARNDLAHFTLDPRRPGAVPFDPADVIAEFAADELASTDELRGVMMHAGRLQYHAPGFPTSSLTALQTERAQGSTGPDVALLDVDWEAVSRLEQDANLLIARRSLTDARQVLMRALALAPEQPKLLAKLAWVEIALGRRDAAADALARFKALEPNADLEHFPNP
jgi:spermidine synthase